MEEVWDPSKLPVKDIRACEYWCEEGHKNVRPKGSGDWLLTLTKIGTGRYTTSRGTIISKPGDMILYAPTDLHDFGTAPGTGEWHYIWVHFIPRSHWLPWLDWPLSADGLRVIRLPRGLQDPAVEALERVVRYYWYWGVIPCAAELARSALEETLLWLHVGRLCRGEVIAEERVSRAMAYINAQLARPLSVEELADHCSLSVSRLLHLFHEHTGMSPRRYLEQQRMQQAAHLLQYTCLSAAEIAFKLGFDKPSYFSSRFHRWSGKSPTQFREAARTHPSHGPIAAEDRK